MEIRRASAPSGQAVGQLWLRAFDDALPTVRRAHSDGEVISHFRDVVVPQGNTWVAVEPTEASSEEGVAERVVGMMEVTDGELGQLYVDPRFQN